jgi:hypothetical protein
MTLQIAREIFLFSLSIMKEILSLMEFKMGKTSSDYLYYKKQVMDSFYLHMGTLFQKLESDSIIKKCGCGAHLRKGYQKCSDCGGSGFKNV